MNADLAAVSRRPGKAGYPLRNRSASSTSGEGGSQTRSVPDPNRYKKYLSLRNRKILEKQNHEETNSNHTASQRTIDSQMQDQSKPLQPILKSTSSRVSDLRYRGDGTTSMHKTESLESMSHHQHQHEDGNDGRAPRDHSPLRVKSQKSNENPRSGGSCSRSGDDQRQRSPIQVYKCATPQQPDDESATHHHLEEESKRLPATYGGDGNTYNTVTRESISNGDRRKNSLERSQGGRNYRGRTQQDPFKSTTEVGGDEEEEEDFHFDFDQDGHCSYVNTTMQSEQTTPKEMRNSAKRSGGGQSNIQQLTTLSQKAETLAAQKKASIRSYADELKYSVKQSGIDGANAIGNQMSDEEAGEESSGYVIDYEQVLKDNSAGMVTRAPPITDYRDDVGQDTILEQTQEAIETDSSPDAYRRRKQNSNRHLMRQQNPRKSSSRGSPDKSSSYQQQDSPQFRRNFTNESEQRRQGRSSQKKSMMQEHPSQSAAPSGFVDEVTQVILQRKAGSKDSPTIRNTHISDTANSDYGRRLQQSAYSLDEQQEPIITFENRQPASSSQRKRRQDADQHLQMLSSSGRSAETGEYYRYDNGMRSDGNDQGNHHFQPEIAPQSQKQNFAQHNKDNMVGNDEQQNQQVHHIFQASSNEMIETEPTQNGDDDDDEDGGYMGEVTPTGQRSSKRQQVQPHYDMAESSKKIARQNEEIEEEFLRQSYGSQPPSSNLVVTCIIRQPMETVGIGKHVNATAFSRSSLGGGAAGDPTNNVLSTARTSKSQYTTGIHGSMRAGISSSVGPSLNRHGLNKSQNGLDISKISSFSGNHRSASRPRGHSQESRSNLSAGGNRRQNSNPKKAAGGGGGKMMQKQVPNSHKHPHILTTQQPSKFVLRSPPGLQAQLLNILLKSELDVNHCQLAFDEHGIQSKLKGRKTMKVFEFDNCIGETKAHSLALGLEQHVKWINQTRPPHPNANTSPKNVIFVFGQSDALKTQLLNVMQPNSLINQCLKARDVRFLRVSTYHLNQEYLLGHKSFGSKQQMRREIGMELREAFRERDLNAKKIALKLSTYSKTVKAEDIKMASHLIIQLDDIVFVDLADIDNLKDTQMAKKISADFSIVTNAILSMSPYYKDHDFGKIEEDRLAPYMDTNNFRSGSISFKNQINRLVSNRSRVLLLCCVIQCSMAGTQAVDYCHKIRSYFHGKEAGQENSIDTTPTRRMKVLSGDVSMETEQNVNAFRQLGGLISEVTKARNFIDKIFANKSRGEPLKRSRNQLKEMVACLRDDVSDLLNSLAANNESYIHQLKKIREMLQGEIYYMREKVTAMRSIVRRNSLGGSSRKSGHALCVLPKTMLQSHQQQPKRGGSSNAGQMKHQQQRNNSSSNIHNFRPQSQTSFHSQGANNVGSNRPHSSRIYNANTSANGAQQKRQMNSRRGSQNQQNRKVNSNTGSKPRQNGTPRAPIHQHEAPPIVHQQTFASHPNQLVAPNSNKKRMVETTVSVGGQTPLAANAGIMRKSHESLPVNSRDIVVIGGNAKNHQSSSTSLKSLPNNRRQSGSKQSTSRNTKARNGGPYQYMNNNQLERGSTSRKQQNTSGSRFSTQKLPLTSTSGGQDQLVATQSYQNPVTTTTVPDDFRKQTLTSLNQQYMLSGAKSCTTNSAAIQESSATPLAATEQLHQEVYALKEQLKQAIEFSEEQADKRKQAEQNCINLTKELTQAETQVADLEDRIIAKDQTIRSLESQLDFHKSKLQQQSPSANQILSSASALQESKQLNQSQQELEILKVEKAQTDQMNQEILGQISMLKEALSTFQEQERTNQKMLRMQEEKDNEMQELKSQVAALIQSQHSNKQREMSPAFEIKQMRQQLNELQNAKEKYRDEALQLKQEMRQQKFDMQQAPERGSRERKRTTSSSKRQQQRVDSQDREPLNMVHPKISSHQNYQVRDQDQYHQQQQVVANSGQTQSSTILPQQKSLNTIKNMIRDFKEQRKGLMRTTSSKEALKQQQQQQQSRPQRGPPHHQNQPQQVFKRQYLRSSRSRENDEREAIRLQQSANKNGQNSNAGYAQLNSHFR